MKFIASEFKEVLSQLKPVWRKIPGNDDGENVSFDTKYAYAYNGITFVSIPFMTDFSGSCDGKKLLSLISSYGNNNVDISARDGKLIIVKGADKSQVPFDDAVDHPVNFAGIQDWKECPNKFLDCLKLCTLTTTTGDDPVTTNIHVDGSIMESFDRIRTTSITMDSSTEEDFFVPAAIVKIMKNTAPTHFFASASWTAFRLADQTIICTRSVEINDYPDISAVMEEFQPHASIELPTNMYDSLTRCSVLANSKEEARNNVRIKTSGRTLFISMSNSNGKHNNKIVCDFDDELCFHVKPKFMQEIIERTAFVEVGDNMLRFTHDSAVSLVSFQEEA